MSEKIEVSKALMANLKKAHAFLKAAKADPNGVEVGAVRDGEEWVHEALEELMVTVGPL